jgi:uncharacterized protein (DUF885 family)
MDDLYEDFIILHPLLASFMGDHRFDDKYIGSYTLQYREGIMNIVKKYKGIDNTIDYVLSNSEYEISHFAFYLVPVSHKQNPFTDLISQVEFDRMKDLHKYKNRILEFIQTIDELKSNLLEGVKRDIVENRQSIKILINSLQKLHLNLHEDKVSKDERAIYLQFMKKVFIPQALEFAHFLEHEYLPHCKTSLGMYGYPSGWYQFVLKNQVNMNLDPEKVYKIGVKHVAQLSRQIKDHKHKYTNSKDVDLFKSRHDIVDFYKKHAKTIFENAASIVTIPKQYKLPLIEAVPLQDEKYEAGAYIMPSDMHNKSKQVFRVNTMSWKKEHEASVKNTIQHEIMPGHSLQEYVGNSARIHKLIKMFMFNDTVEGWALYCEGFFKETNTPEEEYYRLNMSLFRATRLVVDVGIHHKGWSFKKAFDYMKQYVDDSDSMLTSEILRYSSNPGQACTYYLGMLKIKQLRQRYSYIGEKLFNDTFLRLSNYPLFIIEDKMQQIF